jgi:hypothetical protein
LGITDAAESVRRYEKQFGALKMKFLRASHSHGSEADERNVHRCLPDCDEHENVLGAAVSDDALEVAGGSSLDGAPTLAAGSYCFTCPTTFE